MPHEVRRYALRGAIAGALGLAVVACSPASAPSVAAPSGRAVVQALVTALAADPLVTHIEQTVVGTSVNGSTSRTVNSALTGDISGDDVAFHITGSGFESIDTEVVVIGETAYIRQSGGAWTTAPRSAIGSMIDVLIQAVRPVDDPSDLSYVGVETVDGRELHHLTANGTIAYRPAAGGTGKLDAFDIWVEEDGTPVLTKATLSATDPRGSQFSGTADLRFSNFGGSIDIAAPSVAP